MRQVLFGWGGVSMQVLMQRGNYRLSLEYIKFNPHDQTKSGFGFYFLIFI